MRGPLTCPKEVINTIRASCQWQDIETRPEVEPPTRLPDISGSSIFNEALMYRDKRYKRSVEYSPQEVTEAKGMIGHIYATLLKDDEKEQEISTALLKDKAWKELYGGTTRLVCENFRRITDKMADQDLLHPFAVNPALAIGHLAAQSLVTFTLLRQRKPSQSAHKTALFLHPYEIAKMYKEFPDGRGIEHAVATLPTRKHLIPGFLAYTNSAETASMRLTDTYKTYMSERGLR